MKVSAGLIAGSVLTYVVGTDLGVIRPLGEPEPFAIEISESLLEQPGEWRGDHKSITNGDFCVWIGDAVYALGASTGTQCGPGDGGLTKASRYAILSAAKSLVIPRLIAENGLPPIPESLRELMTPK